MRKTQQRQKKKIDNDIMSTNCDVITFFAIYGQFGAIRKPDSGRMICKTYNSYQNCYQKISNTALILLLWVKVLLLLKNVDLLQKTVDIMKIKGVLPQKGIFSETTYLFVLLHQISSFQHNSNEFQTGELGVGVNLHPQPLKSAP